MEHLRGGQTTLTEAEVHRVAATSSTRTTGPGQPDAQLAELDRAPGFRPLARAQHPGPQEAGLCRVTLSLKPTGVARATSPTSSWTPPTWPSATASANCARPRAEHHPGRRRAGQLFTLWGELREQGFATPNIGLLTDIICCPGGDFCSWPTPSRSRSPNRSSAASTTWTTCSTSASWT
jgi:sulfite reductase (NADPH) hemoprotein beta-component